LANRVKKSFILISAFILLFVTGPMPRTFAEAHIFRFVIDDSHSYLIAGFEYIPTTLNDAADSTNVNQKYDYSTDNGATWLNLATFKSADGFSQFVLPIDPHLTNF
jgi:Neuraminidase (sialidase)